MGRLDLIFLLETGAFADFYLICTDSDGAEKKFSVHKSIVFTQCAKIRDLATVAPVRRDRDGIEYAHLEYDPVPFGAVLHFLYSGQYEAELQLTVWDRGQDKHNLDEAPHPLFYSLRALKLAHELKFFEMYGEAAAALCCSAEYLTHHVDFPCMVEELYSTCCQQAQFDTHLNRIAGLVLEKSLVDKNFQDRLHPIMLKHPRLALDVMEAAFEALTEARREAVRTQEEVSDLRAQGFRRDEFWAEAERERERYREMKREATDSFEYLMVRGSLKRGRSSPKFVTMSQPWDHGE
ncbi:hypothetical protein CT0861_05291 [Colletotrichum tofieldiae]|uniref:BTB domain-containing protein n=1 Tax=Colletotrichum tofieldiae TaxID=708197 RepID=A0A166WL30_9PEZI|nr:hypothetical protein CT0861_05291 [Colletotrichum tofieldiae]GKT82761.1 hypothetical protein Ct61P_00611 [Colletotrichum tofieldiae]